GLLQSSCCYAAVLVSAYYVTIQGGDRQPSRRGNCLTLNQPCLNQLIRTPPVQMFKMNHAVISYRRGIQRDWTGFRYCFMDSGYRLRIKAPRITTDFTVAVRSEKIPRARQARGPSVLIL